LENSLFGNECYIASSSNPLKLELTTAPPGTPGKISERAEGGILVISGTSLVDSASSAPEATGCGAFGLLDGLINKKLGLPAATGNSAVLNGTEEQANAAFVHEAKKGRGGLSKGEPGVVADPA